MQPQKLLRKCSPGHLTKKILPLNVLCYNYGSICFENVKILAIFLSFVYI